MTPVPLVALRARPVGAVAEQVVFPGVGVGDGVGVVV
jgi:hypothetical protein